MKNPNGNFRMECEAILNATITKAYCQTLFGVTDGTSPHEINRAFKKLSFKFHPDRNTEHADIANQVQPLLANMRNHLMTGESLETKFDKKYISIDKLLEKIEMQILSNQSIQSNLDILKDRVAQNPKYLLVGCPNTFYTPLRLAVYANDLETFKKWSQIDGTALTYNTEKICLSALHALMREHMAGVDLRITTSDTVQNTPKAQMLAYLLKTFPHNWWVSVCQDTLRTQEYPDVLAFCIQYLQEHHVELNQDLLSQNPFLAVTTWGKAFFTHPTEQSAFFIKHMRNYPELRGHLSATEKNNPDAILAQHYHLKENMFYRLNELRDFAQNANVSPYFVSALLDTLPRCKREINLININNPHAFTYVSLNRH